MNMSSDTNKRIMEEAESSLINKKFKQVITADCLVCNQTLKDARMLPCCHVFCAACLKTHSEAHPIGNDIRCPVCYRISEIPSGGVEKFTSGQFIMKLAEILKQVKDESCGQTKDKYCSPCQGIGRKKSSAGHCAKCKEDLCLSCLQRHGVMNATKDHKTVDYVESEAKKLTKNNVRFCQEHLDQRVEFYCNDCNSIACTECKIYQHKKHNCSDITDSSSKFLQVLDNDHEMIKGFIRDKEEALQCVDESQRKFTEESDNLEDKIKKRYQDLQNRLNEQFSSLHGTVMLWMMARKNELDDLRDDIEQDLDAMRRFQVYWSEVKKYESACDIVQASRSLQLATHELMNEHVLQKDRCNRVARPEYYQISFTEGLSDLDVRESVLGKLRRVIEDRGVTERDGVLYEYETRSSGDEMDEEDEASGEE